MSLRRKLFYLFTLTVVAVLLCLPATGWLARLQLLPLTLPGSIRFFYAGGHFTDTDLESRSDKTVAENPNHFTLRYAHALSSGYGADDTDVSLQRLDELNRRFPQDSVIIAAMLKTMTYKAVALQRDEETFLSTTAEHRVGSYHQFQQQNPELVLKSVALAEVGERLEPRNAYFTVMLAWGYFAARRDADAVAAWVRAGEKTEWEDHTSEEIAANRELLRAENGGNETGAIVRMAFMNGWSFPEPTGMCSTARMAAVMALRAELRGEKEKGFVIRRAIRRVGTNLQNNGKTHDANAVGREMIRIATSRACVAVYMHHPYTGQEEQEQWNKREQSRYGAYLRSIGHPEEAVAYEKTVADGNAARVLINRAQGETYAGWGGKTYRLFGAWCVNSLLLAGVLFSLALAGIFNLVYRFSPRLQKNEPLQSSAKWGVATGIGIVAIAHITSLSVDGWNVRSEHALWGTLIAGAILLTVPPFLLRLSGREVRHGFLVLIATWGALVVLHAAGIVCLLLPSVVATALGLFQSLAAPNPGLDFIHAVAPVVFSATMLSIPLGLLLLVGIFSRMLRVPFAAGVTRGMRAMAIPLACVLTLAWCGTLLHTLHHENAAIAEGETVARIGQIQYLKRMEAGQLER
ncbi:MAG: hypothetical protein H8F28_03605 [Fibrella sp.]|nr:hypothetical protein [Armatimonadota bacterium]